MPDQPAHAYVALVDVDPPLAEHVLDLLGTAAIDAYAEPLAGEVGPYRDVRAPDRPTTRVFVDRTRRDEARTLVGAHLPALRADFHADAAARADATDMARASAAEIDAAWTEIVSGFHDSEANEPPHGQRTDGSGLSARLIRQHSPPPAGPRDYEVVEDPGDERFVPPEPPPLPQPRDRFDVAAWSGVIGGPIAIVLAFVLGWGGWLAGLGFVAFTAGFITLVARSSERPGDDDHGAVV